MAGRYSLPAILLTVNVVAFGLLLGLRDAVQSGYHPSVRRPDHSVMELVGHSAPTSLLNAIDKLPATVILYPACTECTLESPLLLRGQPFPVAITIVLPGATNSEMEKYSMLGPRFLLTSGPAELAEIFDVQAMPKVLQVDMRGILTFIQREPVPSSRLVEVVRGIDER